MNKTHLLASCIGFVCEYVTSRRNEFKVIRFISRRIIEIENILTELRYRIYAKLTDRTVTNPAYSTAGNVICASSSSFLSSSF